MNASIADTERWAAAIEARQRMADFWGLIINGGYAVILAGLFIVVLYAMHLSLRGGGE